MTIDPSLDAHDVMALYRILLWLSLALITWRVGLRAYPTMQAIMTLNAVVYAVMGASALIHGLMYDAASDAWFALVVTPILTAVTIVSGAVWLSKRWNK